MWWPLALVLIILVPLLGILLILVIPGLREVLCHEVATLAPIVVGRWVVVEVEVVGLYSPTCNPLVVIWLAITQLWRDIAADSGGAGTGT